MARKSRNRLKKKRSQQHHVLGHQKSVRLATTVKASEPTVLLGKDSFGQGTVRSDMLPGYAPAPVGIRQRLSRGMSRLAERIGGQERVQPVGGPDKKAQQRLRRMARDVAAGRPPKTKKRHSRLPLFLLLVLGAVGATGYYTYQMIPWETLQGYGRTATKYADVEAWITQISGGSSKEKTIANSKANKNSVRQAKSADRSRKAKADKQLQNRTRNKAKVAQKRTSRKSKKYASAKRTVAKSRAKSSPKSSSKKSLKRSRAQARKAAVAKRRASWKKKTARLQKRAESKYRRASMKYRGKH